MREVFATSDSPLWISDAAIDIRSTRGITSKQFDIHKDGLQFMSTVIWFLYTNLEQLRI